MALAVQAVIDVAERSTVEVDPALYRRLEDSQAFVDLIDAGIFSLVRSRKVPFGIKAGAYVGQVVLEDGVIVRATEKSAGALAALLAWALPSDIRELRVPTTAGEEGHLLRLFAERLTEHVSAYVGVGRLKEYVSSKAITASPHGRIDIRSSIRLRSQGVRDRVAVVFPALTANVLANRLISLGLAVTERVNPRLLGESLLARVRASSMLFEDADDLIHRRPRSSELQSLFDEALTTTRRDPGLIGALTYARIISLHLGAWSHLRDDRLPASYFLNLETLFEDAVRQTWKELSPAHTVRTGASCELSIFFDVPRRYEAEPDIVVESDGRFIAVADCKYKDEVVPSNSDVYQLAVHTEAFESQRAVLVYPGALSSCDLLGTLRGGLQMWVAHVRPNALRDDLRNAIDRVES